jgi:L-lactate dehydrogenase complex protein LldF
MKDNAASFIAKSTIKAADLDHRRKINFNISKYNAVVPHWQTTVLLIICLPEKLQKTKNGMLLNI